ncbi:MAG: hypothetical protein E7331_02750 [Clostridiales bacterium]|nr:hypothetical protein [Clostridiales bacterium]
MTKTKVSPNRFAWLRRLLCISLIVFMLPAYAEENSQGAENVLPGLDFFVDFTFLKNVNRNIVAWLRMEDGTIESPVYQTDDNVYYTKRTRTTSADSNGELFLDCASDASFKEDVWYFYGSIAKEGQLYPMNGLLEEGALQAFPGLVLMTPKGDYRVEVFAGYQTNTKDETSWRINTENKYQFDLSMAEIRTLAGEHLREDCWPEYGDKLLVFNTRKSNKVRVRNVYFAKLTPCAQRAENAVDLNKVEMDGRETENGYVDIEGVGRYMVYAQDDPLWEHLRFETSGSSKVRRFGQGGCGPTAAAIAIANLVPPEELPVMGYYAEDLAGFTFCSCSVNTYRCNQTHVQYHAQTQEEFLRYLPIIMGNFTTGNNEWHRVSRTEGRGTSMDYLEDLCLIFDLKMSFTRYAPDALEMVKEGKGSRIALCSAVRGSPFTGSSHFVVMIYADDEYAYYIDPFRGNDYEKYPKGKNIEVLQPGVLKIPMHIARDMDVSPYYILERAEPENP